MKGIGAEGAGKSIGAGGGRRRSPRTPGRGVVPPGMIPRPPARLRLVALTLAAALLAAPPAAAGTLERFERSATTPKPSPPAEPEAYAADEVEEGLADLLLYGLLGSIVYGGASSWARIRGAEWPGPEVAAEEEPAEEDPGDALPAPRRPGEALIPFARIDLAWQAAEEDVDALDLRGEIGYAMAALQVRRTKYQERLPREELSVTAVHGLYRMSFGRRVEIDLGMGALVLHGEGSHSGFSFTLPVLVHPSDRYGIELRPAWSWAGGDPVADYDVAFLIGMRYLSLKAGYRWVRSGSAHLDGPELGISMRW